MPRAQSFPSPLFAAVERFVDAIARQYAQLRTEHALMERL